jgi:hypothetical protein
MRAFDPKSVGKMIHYCLYRNTQRKSQLSCRSVWIQLEFMGQNNIKIELTWPIGPTQISESSKTPGSSSGGLPRALGSDALEFPWMRADHRRKRIAYLCSNSLRTVTVIRCTFRKSNISRARSWEDIPFRAKSAPINTGLSGLRILDLASFVGS